METQSTAGALSIEEATNLARQTYDAFFRGDIDGLLELYTEDMDWEVLGPSSLPTAGPHIGKEQVRAFFGKVNDLLVSENFDVQQYVVQGDTVVALGEYTWTSKVTGRVFDAQFVHVITIRDGKICKFREYTDTAAAVEAMVD